ncbi:MAG: class F sortase [Patescibacteria group bacterium]
MLFSLLLYHGAFSYAAALKIPEPRAVKTSTDPALAVQIEPALEVATEKNTKKSDRIIIPSIGVNAAIEKVALTPQGAMDVPKNPLNAAWYELGPRPGEIGSAVIDGHVNWFNESSAVFKRLYKVKPGQEVIIEDATGAKVIFIVREVKKFDPATDAASVFTSSDSQAHLNLITCGGVWNKITKQYSERLVVFTDKKI